MSAHRTILFVIAALFAGGISSAASACCGHFAPTTCGGCGTPTAAAVYAEPVAPAPPPVTVTTWNGGCGCACGCRGFLSYAVPEAEVTPIAPAPIYVVNQGPEYSGPGIMVPYHTWTRPGAYAAPYGNTYRYGWYRTWGRRVAYRGHFHHVTHH